eukprot:5139520-Pleurochrysis_carterae.AAC.3
MRYRALEKLPHVFMQNPLWLVRGSARHVGAPGPYTQFEHNFEAQSDARGAHSCCLGGRDVAAARISPLATLHGRSYEIADLMAGLHIGTRMAEASVRAILQDTGAWPSWVV